MNIKKIATGLALFASAASFSSNSFADLNDAVNSMYLKPFVGMSVDNKSEGVKEFNLKKLAGKDNDNELIDNVANHDEDSDVTKLFLKNEGHKFLGGLAAGYSINENFAVEAEYTYFMNKSYKNEDLKALKLFELNPVAGAGQNNPPQPQEPDLRQATLNTEIKRTIHTAMIKGIMKGNIGGGCEVRGIFGVGLASVNLEGQMEYKIAKNAKVRGNEDGVAEKSKSGTIKFDKQLENKFTPAFVIGAGIGIPLSDGVKIVADYGYNYIGEVHGIDNSMHTVKVGAEFAL